ARSGKQLCSSLYALLACCFAISSHTLGRESYPVYSSLTAHEWGTFTSIAGRVGQAVEWSPLTGSTDLFAIPASSAACAAPCAWKHRSSISMTRGKKPSPSKWLSPRASSRSGILAPAASSPPPTYLMALSTSYTPTEALRGTL